MKATKIGKVVWFVNNQKTIEVNTRNIPMKMILPDVMDGPVPEVKKKKAVSKKKKK